MAAFKTIQFLPEVFRTDTNRKFLNATVDQLISEPNLKKVNGYIGRKLAPSYKTTDSYIEEPTTDRQNYQLEPSLVIKNPSTGQIDFATTYTDIVNKIGYYGGLKDRHSRLFDNEYYTYDPKIDLDKFVNFSQYYWLQNGPDEVVISTSAIPLSYTFDVIYDTVTETYSFSGYGNIPNPTITLARGGKYNFVINQASNNFYVQSGLGTSGFNRDLPNISTRSVLGVANNGQDAGTVIFNVPTAAAQVQWTNMTISGVVDYATSLSYSDIQGLPSADLNTVLGGLDGISSFVDGATLVFVNNSYIDDVYWTNTASLDPTDVLYFNQNEIIPLTERTSIYKIKLVQDIDGIERIFLSNDNLVLNEHKVRVRAGTINTGREFYRRLDIFNEVPAITAPLDTLYYQNSNSENASGVIKIVDPELTQIDPDNDIIGQVNYTSPEGIIFTNGLKIRFDSTAIGDYANNSYYVEGVGTSIRLVLTTDLVAPELDNDLSNPDYFTIKRSSLDQNAWSRSNRWFHVDVVEKTAAYNKTDLVLDQTLRAKRPIIEFDASLQLFNFGTEAKKPVDILDTLVTNAYVQIQGAVCISTTSFTYVDENSNSVTFNDGDRVIFSSDANNNVRNKIYNFNVELTTEQPDPAVYRVYFEEATDAEVLAGHTIVVNSGSNGGKQWHYNGTRWIESQQKTAVNQDPKFDVINASGVSFSDTSAYPGSSFIGTKIFSYRRGTGNNDPVLGIPLSYKNFTSQGDIQFDNNFDFDTFTYLIAGGTTQTVLVDSGLLQKNITRDTSQRINIWTINENFSQQFQIYDYVYDGTTNLFPIDYLPDVSTTIPNIKVVLNNTPITPDNFISTRTGSKLAVLINPEILTVGDVVFVSIHNSLNSSSNAYYEVPLNLDVNSLNTNLETLTLGQMRNHLVTLKNNSLTVTGEVPGNSNIRDIVVANKGGSVLQHSAPVIYAGLFLNHPTMNFVDSIKLANREYSQFKIKFLELAANLPLDRTDISGSVDAIMSAINTVKNESFPWHYSDMIPHGEDERVVLPSYTIFDTAIRGYEITNIFQDTVVSNKAVFVYLTRTLDNITTKTLLVKGKDYYFSQTRPAVNFQDNFNLLYGDIITIMEYNNTNGSYVPETPTKLGLYPKYIPEIFVDNTYRDPITVIQGHDGSITPSFGDFRDNLLLELERRIYNNIKVEYDVTLFNINDYMPGKFRATDYTRQEFTQILSQGFLTWVGSNRVDFTTNNVFKSSDPFTWNYKKFFDVVNGETLPGTWRSIYRYFYDTDRPHTHPWEMLGFSEKPDYWEDRYGPAPYTGGNQILWSDLEIGYIHAGSRAGIDIRYQRRIIKNIDGVDTVYGLTQFIPVDDSGNLRSPEEILVTNFDSGKANTSFAVGDIGPAELAWRRSSEYPFALQQALALAKPAKYFALLIDTQQYNRSRVTGQFVTPETGQHLVPATVQINGYINTSGVTERAAGYLNWIYDYIKNLGINDAGKVIKDNLSALTVQLCYKVGGYTDKKFIELLAEQSSPSSINDSVVVPDENYRLEMYKGAPLNKITYSAVIVERSANGYTVSGYDTAKPYFFMIPSQVNNNAYTITVGNQRGVIYKDFKQIKYTIPYGFEFNTKQQVVDFLVGYQRYLKSQGFIFTDRDNELGEQKDWVLSAKEFLHWTSQGWAVGNIIVLSPISDTIKVYDAQAVVDEIKNTPDRSRVLDINYSPIKKNNFTISRESNLFAFSSVANQSIGLAEFDLVQYEHLLILDNQTVFKDIIYVPELGNRQYRLKLVGAKTTGWTGSLELPGFIYSSTQIDNWQSGKDYLKGSIVTNKSKYYTALENITASDLFQASQWQQIPSTELKSGMINNFATNAGQSLNYYDIDNQPINEQLQLFSNGLIGFRNRQYFTNLGIDPTTQSKFYQGLITQKGTANSINALKGAQFNNLNTTVNFYENWAIRVGEYGATDVNQFAEILLPETDFDTNPAVFQLTNTATNNQTDIVEYSVEQLYKSSGVFSADIFRTEDIDQPSQFKSLPVAGFVNLDDVDATIFSLKDYNTLTTIINQIGTGYKIWVARDFDNDWNVYRASPLPGVVFAMRYVLDSTVEVITSAESGLQQDEIIAIKNFDPRFDGVYQVTQVVDSTRFYISLYQNLQEIIDSQAALGTGILFKLLSVKIENPYEVDSITPPDGWAYNDKIWVNDLDGSKNWGVYTKTNPWAYDEKIELGASQYSGRDHFGSAVSLSPDALYMYAGAPDSGSGRVSIYAKNVENRWDPYGFLWGNNANLIGFGKVLANGGGYLVVGAPDSASGQGCLYVFYNQVLIQVIANESGSAADQFGASLAISDDGRYLYVGSPGANTVFCYALVNDRVETTQNILGNGIDFAFTMTTSATYASDIVVTSPLRASEYLPGIDYTVSGTTITFTSLPANFERITIIRRNSYYSLIGTLPGAESAGSNNFGSSIVCSADGASIAVGADQELVNGNANTGAVYTYHRTVTEFVTDGVIGTYTTPDNFNSIFTVKFNNTTLTLGGDYYLIGTNNIQFPAYATPAKGNLITAETNQFVFDQVIYPEVVTSYGDRFGSALTMCSTGCNIYVSSPRYLESNYRFGLVSRYVNLGRVYGTVTGTVTSPTVTSGHSIVINNRVVTFSGTTLDSVVLAINSAQIPGVTASNVNNKLQIDSSVVIVAKKLDIKAGVGTALTDLGITNYRYVQVFKHPEASGETFGSTIKVDQTTSTLVIGSDGGDIDILIDIDSTLPITAATSFDNGTTKFVDRIKDSGAVYVYNLMSNPFESASNHSLFAYTQKLEAPNLDTGFNFGKAIDIVNDYMIVGVTNDYHIVTEGGSVYSFFNKDAKSGWTITRFKEPRVDTEAFNSAFIYNTVSQNIIDFFDYLDPAKGKLLGIVDQEIDYREIYDPASYNKSVDNDTIINSNFYWSDRHVGRTWWDLTTASFIDYEQDSIQYRIKNWGSLFPGSIVKIYEWVESDFLPSQYVANGGNGVPRYSNDTAYSSVTIVNSATGIITQKYYYWVGGKTEVNPNVARRTLSTSILESYISNPKDQNIPYLATLAPNSVALYNISDKLVGDYVALHIDTATTRNSNLLHNEWQLVQQGTSTVTIPARIIDKLRESLVGATGTGALVPDPVLRPQDQLGILSVPRQTLFVNRIAALKTYASTLNTIFLQYPILLISNPSLLYTEEELPRTGFDSQTESVTELSYLNTDSFANGYSVLIPSDSNYDGKWSIYSFNSATKTFELKRLQSYKTELYWTATDWYSSSYVIGKDIAHIVNRYSDLQSLTLVEGDYVKVLDNDQGQWLIYEVDAIGAQILIAAQAATVQLNTSLYDVNVGAGFDSTVYDTVAFDPQAGPEIVNIFNSVYTEILINDLAVDFNNLFFTLINYIFTEQKNPDWIFKTSFIDIYHQLRKLEQIPNYVRDDQTFYQEYVNEVKPYRTQIKEYVPIYDRVDIANGDWTDFDLPSQYDARTATFRSPDISRTSDAELFTTDNYSNWANNYTNKVSDFIIGNVGLNYSIAPNVEITGGGGIGATAITTINNSTGKLTGIFVTNAGSGYTSTPTVYINGDGKGATAYPLLHNEYFASNANLSYNTVRDIVTTIKFDRLVYESNLVIWQANTAYSNTVITSGNIARDAGNIYVSSGNIIVYNNEAFLAVNANVSSQSIFDFTRYNKISNGNVLLNAVDRIFAYYQPRSGMSGKDPAQLMSGIEYPGVKVSGPEFRSNAFEITSNVFNFNYTGLTINSGNVQLVDFGKLGFALDQSIRIQAQVPFPFLNNGYFTIVNVSSDQMTLTGDTPIETTYKVLLDTAVSANVGDYITQSNTLANAYVLQTVTNSRELDIVHITTGFTTELPNVISINGITTSSSVLEIATGGNANVTISYLDLSTVTDTIIQSDYLDTALGTRPEDINIVGGAYVDTYSSHAPEELVPGRVYDTLEMRVFTRNVANTATWGYTIFKSLNDEVEFTRISAAATTRLSANLNINDTIIRVADATVLPEPNPANAVPGVVNINGERISYYRRYTDALLTTATPWAANTEFTVDSLISFNSNVYRTLGNVYANANVYISSSNVELVTANTLGQIRRGIGGTGAANVHAANSRVIDTSSTQIITGNTVYTTWLNMAANVADGTGLEGSTTSPAQFIKAQVSYTP